MADFRQNIEKLGCMYQIYRSVIIVVDMETGKVSFPSFSGICVSLHVEGKSLFSAVAGDLMS